MTLYEIDTRIDRWEPEVDPDTGEILNFSELDDLNIQRQEKLEHIALCVKNLRAEAEAIRKEEKTLSDRRCDTENKARRLQEYLSNALSGEKLKTPRVSVSYRKVSSVELDDEFITWAAINRPELLRFPPLEPNKTEIKARLSLENEIPYARIKETTNLNIK